MKKNIKTTLLAPLSVAAILVVAAIGGNAQAQQTTATRIVNDAFALVVGTYTFADPVNGGEKSVSEFDWKYYEISFPVVTDHPWGPSSATCNYSVKRGATTGEGMYSGINFLQNNVSWNGDAKTSTANVLVAVSDKNRFISDINYTCLLTR